jgi:ATP-dependent Clp protease protease subunit
MSNYYSRRDELVEEMKVNSALQLRTIYLHEDVDDDIMFKIDYFIRRIVRLDEEQNVKPHEAEPITIMINSFGGSVMDGLSLGSLIINLKEKGYIFHTEVMGYALSMGSFLAQLGTHRTMRRYASMLYHQVSSSNSGTLADMEVSMEQTKKWWEILKKVTIEHTNLTEELLNKIHETNRDLWLSAEECLTYGIIDEII